MEKKLQTLGVETCSELQKFSSQALQREFGPKTGLLLYQHCRGIDDRALKTERERKSVSAEINYGIRFTKVRWIVFPEKRLFFGTVRKKMPANQCLATSDMHVIGGLKVHVQNYLET